MPPKTQASNSAGKGKQIAFWITVALLCTALLPSTSSTSVSGNTRQPSQLPENGIYDQQEPPEQATLGSEDQIYTAAVDNNKGALEQLLESIGNEENPGSALRNAVGTLIDHFENKDQVPTHLTSANEENAHEMQNLPVNIPGKQVSSSGFAERLNAILIDSSQTYRVLSDDDGVLRVGIPADDDPNIFRCSETNKNYFFWDGKLAELEAWDNGITRFNSF